MRKLNWYSITYPGAFDSPLVQFIWRKLFCPRGWHLWDETAGLEDHTIFCDACEFDLYIDDAKTLQQLNELPPLTDPLEQERQRLKGA